MSAFSFCSVCMFKLLLQAGFCACPCTTFHPLPTRPHARTVGLLFYGSNIGLLLSPQSPMLKHRGTEFPLLFCPTFTQCHHHGEEQHSIEEGTFLLFLFPHARNVNIMQKSSRVSKKATASRQHDSTAASIEQRYCASFAFSAIP